MSCGDSASCDVVRWSACSRRRANGRRASSGAEAWERGGSVTSSACRRPRAGLPASRVARRLVRRAPRVAAWSACWRGFITRWRHARRTPARDARPPVAARMRCSRRHRQLRASRRRAAPLASRDPAVAAPSSSSETRSRHAGAHCAAAAPVCAQRKRDGDVARRVAHGRRAVAARRERREAGGAGAHAVRALSDHHPCDVLRARRSAACGTARSLSVSACR